jgi:hypothetical protein
MTTTDAKLQEVQLKALAAECGALQRECQRLAIEHAGAEAAVDEAWKLLDGDQRSRIIHVARMARNGAMPPPTPEHQARAAMLKQRLAEDPGRAMRTLDAILSDGDNHQVRYLHSTDPTEPRLRLVVDAGES